jgi:hypothetical protein
LSDARAVSLWEKIKNNLAEADIDLDGVDDAEQIKAIEYTLGVGREIKAYGAPDGSAMVLKINKTIPASPSIEVMSLAFHDSGGKAHVRLKEALTIELREGRLHIATRPVTW